MRGGGGSRCNESSLAAPLAPPQLFFLCKGRGGATRDVACRPLVIAAAATAAKRARSFEINLVRVVMLWRVRASCGGMACCFVGRKADSQSALFGNSPIFRWGELLCPGMTAHPAREACVRACVPPPFVSPLSTGYLDERRGGGIWLAPPLWVVVANRLRRLRPPLRPPRARPLRRRRPAPRHHDAPPAQSPSPAPIVADRANATHVTTRPSCAPCRSLQLPSAVADANAATAAVAATAITSAPAQPSGPSPAYLFP